MWVGELGWGVGVCVCVVGLRLRGVVEWVGVGLVRSGWVEMMIISMIIIIKIISFDFQSFSGSTV